VLPLMAVEVPAGNFFQSIECLSRSAVLSHFAFNDLCHALQVFGPVRHSYGLGPRCARPEPDQPVAAVVDTGITSIRGTTTCRLEQIRAALCDICVFRRAMNTCLIYDADMIGASAPSRVRPHQCRPDNQGPPLDERNGQQQQANERP